MRCAAASGLVAGRLGLLGPVGSASESGRCKRAVRLNFIRITCLLHQQQQRVRGGDGNNDLVVSWVAAAFLEGAANGAVIETGMRKQGQ